MSTQMTYAEYISYAAEINTLKRLLDGLPEERASVRYGFEHRLERAQQRIAGVPVPPRPKKLAVSFTGKPVQADRGINANFAAESVNTISDAVRLSTSGLTGQLKETGQIPKSTLGQPIITGVVMGSFGFEMELPTPADDPDGFSYPEEAINLIQNLLKSVSEGSDGDLSNAAGELHPRAVSKVADLLDLMRKREAQFTVEYQGNTVRFDSDADIENAAERLSETNVQDDTREIIGTMVGIVPATRAFQLDPTNGPSIHGYIGREIGNPRAVAQQYTQRRVRVRIHSVRVGRGAPRHTMLRISGETDPNPQIPSNPNTF